MSVDSSPGNEADGSSDYPSISPDGRYVAFQSRARNLVTGDNNSCRDIFVHDRLTGQTHRASVDSTGVEGDDESKFADVSSNGIVTVLFHCHKSGERRYQWIPGCVRP